MSDFDLHQYLACERERVEAALERALSWLARRLPPDVGPAVRHGVLGGGKRLRPILCVTAYRACGGRGDGAAYDLAVSLELIHAYSLMHDDLPCMDDAELRRGRAATHRQHGETTTIVAGATLIPGAALQALRSAEALGCAAPQRERVVVALLEAAGAGGMVGGQWLDLLGEGRSLSQEELDGLHRRKTGALLAAALIMGAAAAGAPAATREALATYGRSVGLAFQITDDILDATSTAEALGKHPSDQDLEKSTYVALHGLESADARARQLAAEARRALQGVGLRDPALTALADYVVDRRH